MKMSLLAVYSVWIVYGMSNKEHIQAKWTAEFNIAVFRRRRRDLSEYSSDAEFRQL